MDAVILAAGRGARLAGLVPAFHKPLLLRNGRSLIWHVVKWVRDYGCDRVIVVVSPDNANAICQVLPSRTRFVIQPTAVGPADAAWLGAELVRSAHTLVACADNVFQTTPCDAKNYGLIVDAGDRHLIVSSRLVDDGARFTRIVEVDGEYHPVRFFEGPVMDGGDCPTWHRHRVWVGPLIVPTSDVLQWCGQDKIGPLLNDVEAMVKIVPFEAEDIGVPEAIQ